jgi:sugar/nucleoside kinase (ribokinase family)
MLAEPAASARRVLCFGAAHWDVVARPRPGARGRDAPGEVERRIGGVAINVALGLAAAGIAATLVTAIGDDAEGDDLLSRAAEAGIATEGAVRYQGAPTGRYVAIEKADGELLAAVSDDRALDAMLPEHLPLSDLPAADAWFIDANLAPRVIRALAAAPGRPPLLADATSEAKAPRLREILAGIDTLYCNRREAEAITAAGLNAARAAAESLVIRGVRRAVVTDGPLAAADAGPHGVAVLRPEPGRPRSTTGAGDALIAAHIAAAMEGLTPEAALAAGLAAARRRMT